MSIVLRILLFVVSSFTMIFIVRKIRKSQMQVLDAMFWLVLSVGVFLMSLLPQIVTSLAKAIGVISPVNFVFLIIQFLLIGKCFSLSVRISCLEEKIKELVEELAIRKKVEEENDE